MKSKTKLALLSAALSCAVLGAVGATTFAWFSRGASASVSFSQFTAKANTTNIDITIIPKYPAVFGVDSSDQQSSIALQDNSRTQVSMAGSLLDMSSDYGGAFYTRNYDGGAANYYKQVNALVLASSVFQFYLKIGTMEVAQNHKIQATLNWEAYAPANSEASAASTSLVPWLRGSIIETDSTYAYSSAISKQCFKYGDAENDDKYISGPGQEDIGTIEHIQERQTYVNFSTHMAATTKYFVVTFWMEGSLVTDQDAARGGQVNTIAEFRSIKV